MKIHDGVYRDLIYNKLREQPKPSLILMKLDPSAMKVLLRKREMALQKIIRQMKYDNLNSSQVYKNLEQELETLKNQRTEDGKKQ